MKSSLDSISVVHLHPPRHKHSLVHLSLDIGRVLADRNGVTFRAHGTCMFPTVRPGDVLTIESRSTVQVSVGDIAVCRAPDFLFSHRVIEKGEQEGRVFIVTRPDRAKEGSDGPTYDENLLGVVVGIKRKGIPVPLQSIVYPWFTRWYYKGHLWFIEGKERFKLWLTDILADSGKNAFYRFMTRTWFSIARPRLKYVVQTPLNNTLGNAIFRHFDPDEFDPEMLWNGRNIARWVLALYLNDAREPGASATFVRNSENKWSLEESNVRIRYRAAGLDDMLKEQAQKILAKSNR